jgi:hypothetical protein
VSFDEEWARLVAEATREREVRTRLNTLDGDEGGGGAARLLHVTPGELTQRAGTADTLRGNFAEADNAALKETRKAAAGLRGFKSAAAFATFHERWEGQMKYLQNLLDDGVAKPLRAAAGELQREDSHQARVIDGLKPAEDEKDKDK